MASWNKKRMLVSGIDDFIGSHLTELLIEEIAIAWVKDNLNLHCGNVYAY